jgi:hypothetical protein
MKRLLQVSVIVTFAVITARAASVSIAGSDTGSFPGGVSLSFANSAFNVTTDASGDANNVQFGTFGISNCSGCAESGTFALKLNFSIPGEIGTATANVSASYYLIGDVATVTFDPSIDNQTVNYTTASGAGSFQLTFNSSDNITLCTGSSCGSTPSTQAALFNIANAYTAASSPGLITAGKHAATPEPEVTILFVTMLAGIGFTTRKKLFRRSA